MGFFGDLGYYLRGQSPAKVYKETASFSGFLQIPTAPAPDAKALLEHEQVSAVIGRLINVISEDCASVPLRLYDVTQPNEPKEIFDHAAIILFRWINRVESPVVYMRQLWADLVAEGNHFGWLDRDTSGTPISIIRIPPEQITVEPDSKRLVRGYSWKRTDGKTPEFYSDEEILHPRTRNPNGIYRGLGLLPRGRDQIHLESSLRSYKFHQLKNGIPTSLVVNMKRDYATDEERERFREDFYARMRGVENAGKPIFLKGEDVEIKDLPRPKEDEVGFFAGLTHVRNELAMLFGVPPSRLSDYSQSFRSASTEQSRNYWQDTIMAWHGLFLDYLNSTFIPRWFPNDVDKKTRIPRIQFAYDYTKVRALALSMRDMATVQEILIRNGMRTPNEGTIAMGDPKHDDPAADELYMNGSRLGEKAEPTEMPGSQPTGGEERPEGETDPEDEADEDRGAGEGVWGGMGGEENHSPAPPLVVFKGNVFKGKGRR